MTGDRTEGQAGVGAATRLSDHLVTYLSEGGEQASAALRALRQRLRARHVMQANEQGGFPLLPAPFPLDGADQDRLRRASREICGALAGLPWLLFGDLDTALRILRVPASLLPFVRCEVPLQVPIWRCDYLRSPAGWRAVEVNSGAGLGELLIGDYNRCVREEPLLAAFLDRHGLVSPDPMDALAAAVRQRCADLPIDDRPTVAIIDWEGFDAEYVLTSQRVADYYQAHGMRAVLCHQREVRYQRGRLWHGQRPVDVVHRAFLLEDVVTDADSARPVLEAAGDGRVVLVSSFRDEWLASKAAFAMLHEAVVRDLLSDPVRATVTDMVPPTWFVTDDISAWQEFAVSGAHARTSASTAGLVRKPVIGSASAGVVFGLRTSDEEFWGGLDEQPGTCVLQSLIEPAPVPFPHLDGDRLAIAPLQPQIGVYLLDDEVRGVSTRALPGTEPGRNSSYFGAMAGAVWYPPTPAASHPPAWPGQPT